MRQFGLIGFPLSHSFSAGYFAQKFNDEKVTDASYENFSISSIELFPEIVKTHPKLIGVNVTIPYKEKIIPYLDELDKTAREVNAVNTVKIFRNEYGRTILKGYNTDVYGFKTAIQPYLTCSHKNALILGTGGASKAVAFILSKLSIHCESVSRRSSENVFKTYDELVPEDLNDFQLIVNTTPLGMFPNIADLPAIPYNGIFKGQILFDLIYNPAETQFLIQGKAKGAITINGLEMLKHQAEKSWEIWND